MDLYTHKHVLEIFPDLKARTLIDWCESGMLIPAQQPDGTGTRRQYSLKNLVEIGVLRELVSYRFSRELARNILGALNKRLTATQDYDFVIVASRQYNKFGFIEDIRIGSRRGFADEAAELIFNERPVVEMGLKGKSKSMSVCSAVIVSVADVRDFVANQL